MSSSRSRSPSEICQELFGSPPRGGKGKDQGKDKGKDKGKGDDDAIPVFFNPRFVMSVLAENRMLRRAAAEAAEAVESKGLGKGKEVPNIAAAFSWDDCDSFSEVEDYLKGNGKALNHAISPLTARGSVLQAPGWPKGKGKDKGMDLANEETRPIDLEFEGNGKGKGQGQDNGKDKRQGKSQVQDKGMGKFIILFDPILDIFIQTLTGETFILRVKESDTIHSVKVKIREIKGTPLMQQRLFFFDHPLDIAIFKLSMYNIQNESTLKLIVTTLIVIFIQRRQGVPMYTLDVEASDTIQHVKYIVAERDQLVQKQIRLCFRRQILYDDRTLSDYNIGSGDILDVYFPAHLHGLQLGD